MTIITNQNVGVISSELTLIKMIEKTQCLGNGFPCMAESQVTFSKEKFVPSTFGSNGLNLGLVQLVPEISNIFTSLFWVVIACNSIALNF